jgi:hypothetical protein
MDNQEQIINEPSSSSVTKAMLTDMQNYMMAQQRQQTEQNAKHESQIQLTNNLMAQMMEMTLTIRNESVQQNNSLNTQLATLVTKGKSHPKNALELFANASAIHCLTDSLVAVQLSKKNMDKGGKLLHRISAELDQFDLSFEHVKRDDPRIKVVDDLGRDASSKKVPKKVRYIEDHQSNGYFFRTSINERETDCMIDSGAALSMMRLTMAEQADLEIVMLEEPKEFYGSHPFESRYFALSLALGPEETISVKFYLIEGDEIFGPDTDDCILGQEFLQEYATEWDFNHRTICLAHEGLNYLIHVDDDPEREEASRVDILNRADIITTLTLPGVEPNTKIKVPLRLYGSGKYYFAMNHLQQVTTNAATQEPLQADDWNTLIPLLRNSVLVNGG